MAISKEIEAQILRYYHAEQWRIGTIARQLDIHTDVVHRVLAQTGIPRARRAPQPSIVDAYIPWIEDCLQRYPKLPASRLYEMARERGYPGGPDHFRHLIAQYRPRAKSEAFLRLSTMPGEQAQIDWAHFGKQRIGNAKRPLMAFVMVLSYSRWIFLQFFYGSAMANFLRGHVAAFEACQGVSRVLLYDNLKSAVLERRADVIRFHPDLLSLSAHYGFEPRPVAVARGNEKGRVERAIGYVRTSFWPAREFCDIDDLNEQAREWCHGVAADRRSVKSGELNVRKLFAEEQKFLRPLPDDRFPCQERETVRVGKTPYVRFDLNDYSVPHDCVRRTLTVIASPEQVQVHDGDTIIATHQRSYDRHAQIEDPRHIEALTQEKRAARTHRGADRLIHAAPSAEELLKQAASRTYSLGSIAAALLRLLERYGSSELEAAIQQALERGVPHQNAVHQILEQRREQRSAAPSLPLQLPEKVRLRESGVRIRKLSDYDSLSTEEPDDALPE